MIGSAHKSVCSIVVPAALLAVAPAWTAAAPLLTAESLRDDCRAYQADAGRAAAVRCEQYVLGFIHGVLASDGAAASRAQASRRAESWIERAMRTRLGRAQVRTAPVRLVYCFDDPLPMAEVIARILDHLDSDSRAVGKSAADVLQSVLEEHYLCTSTATAAQ